MITAATSVIKNQYFPTGKWYLLNQQSPLNFFETFKLSLLPWSAKTPVLLTIEHLLKLIGGRLAQLFDLINGFAFPKILSSNGLGMSSSRRNWSSYFFAKTKIVRTFDHQIISGCIYMVFLKYYYGLIFSQSVKIEKWNYDNCKKISILYSFTFSPWQRPHQSTLPQNLKCSPISMCRGANGVVKRLK